MWNDHTDWPRVYACTCVHYECMLSTCWAMGLGEWPICGWWRGCTEMRKRYADKLADTTGKTRGTHPKILSVGSKSTAFQWCILFMRWPFSFLTSWLGIWPFFIQILKAISLWSRPDGRKVVIHSPCNCSTSIHAHVRWRTCICNPDLGRDWSVENQRRASIARCEIPERARGN